MRPQAYPTPPTPIPPAPIVPATAKLVRDRIPDLAATAGHPGTFRPADPAEFDRRLRDKLLEEAHEAAAATSPAALLGQLGDLLQVVNSLASQAGHSPAAVEAARARKARTHGSYIRRLVWHQPTTDVTP
jgi:predicted house-cleaning noncanonical NTP pyrophosphatase (MazG superfamily)